MKNWMQKIAITGILIGGLVSCKKDSSTSLEIAIASDEIYHSNVSVNVKEVWLNYATKKSKSEWLRLDIVPSTYNLAYLYNNQKDTVILPQTTIENLETLLQIRFIFGEQGNSVITVLEDTLDLSMSSSAMSGIKIGLNKAIDKGKQYDLRLAIKADSISLHQNPPVFSPSIRVDSLTIK
jgi:hypothetical protein